MHCPTCNMTRDQDAAFCIECGDPLIVETTKSPAKARRSYLFIFVLVPALAFVAGLGYYKFFLPDGIAAVINGENIKVSEIDAAVRRVQGTREAPTGRDRYQVLNQLIVERIVLQEARKAEMKVTGEEMSAAFAEARTASGANGTAFNEYIISHYGSMKTFKEIIEQRLLMAKFFEAKVVPPGADPQTARSAVERWIQEASDRASVRISLPEHGSGPGCGGCCNKGNGSEINRHPQISKREHKRTVKEGEDNAYVR